MNLTRMVFLSTMLALTTLLVIRTLRRPDQPTLTPNAPPQSSQYDVYMLATEWAGTTCRVQNCNSNIPSQSQYFNLHGLWPNINAKPSTSPQNCTSVPLNYDALPRTVQNSLWISWNSLYNDENSFVSHEWDKHGTCWDPTMAPPATINQVPTALRPLVDQSITDYQGGYRGPTNYLQTAIQLAHMYNPFDVLASGNVLPDDTNKVQISQIRAIYKAKFGINNMSIVCVKTSDGRYLLSEVRICLTLTYNPTDCGSTIIQGCQQDLIYPTSL